VVMKSVLVGCALLAGVGCQDDIKTPFPAGLEPLEDNVIPVQQGGEYTEMLRTSTSDSNEIKIYGLGYVLAAPGDVWAASKNPEANVAMCSTNQQDITPNNDPAYEFSFIVYYTVNNVLTVQWDDQWRWGVIEGTLEAPTLGMIKHQKTDGSSFIELSEGTIQLAAVEGNPDVTELSFVEHLKSVGGGVSDVLKGVQHNYDALVAVAHGNPIPACP